MNEIVINKTALTAREYSGQRVLTFRDIDTVHQRPDGTARKRFNDNKQRFIENVDYFKITPSEFRTELSGEMDLRQQNDVTLVTETGYLMIVKSFTDDLAWEVQRQLVGAYFRLKDSSQQEQHTGNDSLKTAEALVSAVRDKLAAAEALISAARLLTPSQQELILPEISAILTNEHKPAQTGTNINKLPFYDERRKALKEVYFAAEIAEMFGVTPHKIGRLATRLGMKTDEYGVMFTDISPYTGKKFAKFGYNEKAVEKFREIFGENG